MSDFYRDRVALVVGASEGIGKAVAAALVGRGARVIVAARRPDRLEDARAEVGAVHASAFDAGRWPEVVEAVAAMGGAVGPPEIVVNCAGLARSGWLVDADPADLEEMTRVNFLGTVHVCKAVLPAMIERRGGAIVNVASIGGLLGLYGYTGYCGTKFAVVGFSEALRREVAPYGIRVKVLCPPNTRTPGLARENMTKPPEVLAQEEKVATLEPDAVARHLLDALPRRGPLVIPSLDGRLAWRLSRFAPWLLDRILRRGDV